MKKTDITGTREQIEIELIGRYDNDGNYTNNDVIEAVKAVTGQDIEEDTATVTTAKGNEVDISDLWKSVKITISKRPEDANTTAVLLEVTSVEGPGIYTVSTEEELESFMQEVTEMDETSTKEIAKIAELNCCNYYESTEFTTFDEVLQYEYNEGWITEPTWEAFVDGRITGSYGSIGSYIEQCCYWLLGDGFKFNDYVIINPNGEVSDSYLAKENGTYTFTVKCLLTGKTYKQSVNVTNVVENSEKAIIEQQDGDCTIDEYGTIGDLSDWHYEIYEDDFTCSLTGSSEGGCYGTPGYYGEEMDVIVPKYIKLDGVVYRVSLIGSYLFAGMGITSLKIPEGVIAMEEGAVWYNYELREVWLPESLVSIGDGCFEGCKALESVSFGSNVESLGACCFYRCLSLEEIKLPANIREIGKSCFNSSGLKSVWFEFLEPPEWGTYCFHQVTGNGEGVTFYFKNSEVADSFTSDYYDTAYGVKSDIYDW